MKWSIKFWNLLAKNYDKQVNQKYKKAYEQTIQHSRNYLQKSNAVLDVGCGTGITTFELFKNVKHIFAIDTSNKMIQVAQSKCPNHFTHVDFEVMDIFNPALDSMKFDVILVFNTLHFIKNEREFLQRVSDLLTANGLLISVTDCLDENKSLKTKWTVILSKLGLFPYIKAYTITGLENIVTKNTFQIIETYNFFENPPNYFIVAKKKLEYDKIC